jgi:endogenous inhibitor of DNA gyrase (YacG/DUF329 family)
MLETGLCKSCGAPVAWVTMIKKDGSIGKKNPLDIPANGGGNIEARKGRSSDEWYGRVTGTSESERRYTSHFATCPNADRHRKRTPTPVCPRCGEDKPKRSEQVFTDGRSHIRADCGSCGAFIRWDAKND